MALTRIREEEPEQWNALVRMLAVPAKA
ncbi:protein of unknown function [Methanoculleus bourgensis]|uniref:Uncharacterized protein n=1 Tax=Methanoculleus bourgensis TaxID=83986 RepID=A0A0X3BQI4_9EURY|nr:protein of unknown function [Methanoculleus bourgensis]